uniref:Uncharacterized protein n=1 Tax=Candidatus Kentrum sp. TUN TaxID=2126343 RepID=A0A450ZI94_9GAMM|nr:MAG: hypothetical protein BECKTUN1418F_GA0071002_102311 [Candidatus Kentron sp. TUN]VFK55624.1 MAG: hypothetical protein BECKTUN1418E_GA0071001_103111 [Candidatus Kentron sp. TUN]
MKDLKFKVFNRKRESTLTYRINHTSKRWHIAHIAINGDCEPDGTHLFYANFNQDYISYPRNFGNYLEWLWEQVNEGVFDKEETQKKLQELADWVTTCEQSCPEWEGWNV